MTRTSSGRKILAAINIREGDKISLLLDLFNPFLFTARPLMFSLLRDIDDIESRSTSSSVPSSFPIDCQSLEPQAQQQKNAI